MAAMKTTCRTGAAFTQTLPHDRSALLAQRDAEHVGLFPLMPERSDRPFVLDGTNILLIYGRYAPKLEAVLTVATAAAWLGSDVICVFDANTPHLLADYQSPEHSDAYLKLLEHFDDTFVQVTGGTRADDVILPEAAARDALIVSNDRFWDYVDDYPFIASERRVLRVNAVRDCIHFARRLLPLTMSVCDLKYDLAGALLAADGCGPCADYRDVL